MRNISDKICGENQNTNFVSSNFFPPRKSCHLWANVAKYCRAGQTTYQYGACALHAGYLSLQVHTRASITTLYVHCLSCEIGDRIDGLSAPGFGNSLNILNPSIMKQDVSWIPTKYYPVTRNHITEERADNSHYHDELKAVITTNSQVFMAFLAYYAYQTSHNNRTLFWINGIESIT